MRPKQPLITILVITITSCLVAAFPTGPPVDSIPRLCSSMNPLLGHGLSTVSSRDGVPYTITADSATFSPGQQIRGNAMRHKSEKPVSYPKDISESCLVF